MVLFQQKQHFGYYEGKIWSSFNAKKKKPVVTLSMRHKVIINI